MKKILFVLIILVISLAPAQLAYAGSLNENEQQIVNAARGKFEYQGNQYRLDEAYINQLIAYLAEEGRDLTKEDRDTVLQSMNNYIETGVKEGYLVPINVQKVQKDTSSPNTSKDSNTSTDNNASSDNEDKSGVGNTEDTTSNDNSDMNNEKSNNSKISSSKDFLGGLLSEDTSSDNSKSGQVTKMNGADTLIIKNTGFNLNNTFIIAVMLGVIMLAGMIVTMKNNFFAQNDE
jgi:hypothetical protein